ncbi:MAG: di-trans,poly-cis-decaprenylcistransferase [Candidatus Epulonipiscium fishelsonii]|nr:MAG: di-trans,poly-cis-decaprenylcistransferase [Epulopiscium sp. AS2M-Bin002]
MRIPRHIAVIPDGNRRWAENIGLKKHQGYTHGLDPGLMFLKLCQRYGVKELTYYGFTTDNCKRPKVQVKAFSEACVQAVKIIENEGVSLLVVGNTESELFPKELLSYTERTNQDTDFIRVNMLVNYGWEWDLGHMNTASHNRKSIYAQIKSHDVSRIDLVVRLGGRNRLSGLLPIQSVYADFFSSNIMWPDFTEENFISAIEWYNNQDITLGG